MITLTQRDEQLAALDARWSRARTGAGQLVLVEGAAATGKTELLSLPHSGVIHTAPLSRQGVDTFLAGTFGPLTAQLLTDPFHAASGGNPYLLTALVDDLRAGRGIAGRRYQQALLDCVRRCGPLALLGTR
jgi:predicted ATPase